ncbi:aminocyclopropane-1-carboxylate deaminase/D-cysteine desulfhydrase family protein [Thermotoga sp. Ku-13t]|uniref:D-cysteine desulfhydrase family protein n=1 Tax=Thermotoga sp. Ku-13t TaxID=1755813 RepID=UPI0013ED84D5|nr:D-cysteine desulfhydrase family protein [Thermotoga sp. Ku-13t]KAF2957559.1 aminocyclopropane-1-carboxylate deaminase/D-cysteine desulfhydrase family protein [Thermotoga sp. Ku-13t]
MKLSFARLPTPIEMLPRLSKRYEREIFVKRDDLTEFISSGNKIRKLEFLLADAVRNRCDTVFTCGGEQSNHARATAHLCVKLGLKPVLFLRESQPEQNNNLSKRIRGFFASDEAEWKYFKEAVNGNLLIDKLLGAEIVFLSHQQYVKIDEVFEEYKEKYESQGRRVYIIPEGGSNALGALGYVWAVAEMTNQIDLSQINAIYCAVGSGGTYAGLLAGLRSLGYETPVIGINVTKREANYFVEKVLKIIDELAEYGIKVKVKPEEIKITDDFSGPAYAVPTEADVECIKITASAEGIILDPVYTAKAFRGMLQTSKRGQKVLFVHTGGTFGLFAQAHRFMEL